VGTRLVSALSVRAGLASPAGEQGGGVLQTGDSSMKNKLKIYP